MPQFSSRVRQISKYPSAQLAQKKKELAAQGKKVFDFGAGDPIEPTADFIRQAVGQAVPVVSQYPAVRGLPAHRKAIADYVQRRFKVTLNPDTQVLPCTGSKESIFNFTFIFAEPGGPKDTVLGPSPGYFVMARSALISGMTYHPVPLAEKSGYLLELASLPEDLLKRTALVWLNYPHNPTGANCDLAYYRRQVETAARYDIVIASDECYVDIYFGTTPPPSILEVTTKNVVAFHSCSKRSGMTAYRAGFAAGDAEILDLFGGYRDTLGVATPVYTQAAAIAAWNDDAHPADRRRIFADKRRLFEAFFTEEKISYTKTDATFYYWIDVPAGLTGATYADLLLTQGLVVSPGASFGVGSEQKIRIALVPSIADCTEAIGLWRTVLRQYQAHSDLG